MLSLNVYTLTWFCFDLHPSGQSPKSSESLQLQLYRYRIGSECFGNSCPEYPSLHPPCSMQLLLRSTERPGVVQSRPSTTTKNINLNQHHSQRWIYFLTKEIDTYGHHHAVIFPNSAATSVKQIYHYFVQIQFLIHHCISFCHGDWQDFSRHSPQECDDKDNNSSNNEQSRW